MSMIETLYIAVPAFVANMLPVVAARLNLFPALGTPIKVEWFGEHKTYRGFIVGIAGACIIAILEFFVFVPQISTIFYAILFGVLAGSGALIGDLAESFAKREIGIESGKPFIPFDQIDYMLGFLLFTYPLMYWSLWQIIFLALFALVANPIVNALSYTLGIKKTFW